MKLIENLLESAIGPVLLNITVFGVIALIIVTPFAVSMILVVLVFLALLQIDRKKLMSGIFEKCMSHRAVWGISFIVLAIILPLVLSNNAYHIHILIMACIYGMLALGLNFQMGSANMVNFAMAVFFGTGAYTSALLAVNLGVNPWISSLVGILFALAIGFLIGIPTLKTKGYYLSLITLAMQTIFNQIIINTDSFGGSNGVAGIPAYKLFGHSFRSSFKLFGAKIPYGVHYYYLAMVLLIIMTVIAVRLRNSRSGLSWNAVGEDESSAICQGINIPRVKLIAFSTGAAFAGAAGALYGHYISFIGPEDFDFMKSLIIICMVILGGMDNVTGVLTGAIFLTLIDEKLRDFSDVRMALYAAILLITLLTRPEGMIPKTVREYKFAFSDSRILAKLQSFQKKGNAEEME